MTRTVLVVTPTYNEIDNVGPLLDRVRRAMPHADVLVVDDGSPDGTGDAVAARATVDDHVFLLRRDTKDGLGAAYRAGFAWAARHGYPVMVQMDADLSHPPERLPALVDALGTADVALGSRYVRGGSVHHWPWFRRLVSWLGNVYVALVLGLPVKDATGGFKAFRMSALVATGALTSHSNGYCFQVETTWRAVRRGLVVAEVPIAFTDRVDGTSKMSTRIVVEAVLRVLAWRVEELRPTSLPKRAARAAR